MQGTEGKWTPGGFQIVPGSFACLHGSVRIKIRRLISLASNLFWSSRLIKCAPFSRMFLVC